MRRLTRDSVAALDIGHIQPQAGLKRNLMQAQTSFASRLNRQDCAAGKNRRQKFGVYP
jgi:hypothetical protein